MSYRQYKFYLFRIFIRHFVVSNDLTAEHGGTWTLIYDVCCTLSCLEVYRIHETVLNERRNICGIVVINTDIRLTIYIIYH